MKIAAMTAVALVVGAPLFGEKKPLPARSVTVCIERGSGFGSAFEARTIASKMFAEIGVTIKWHVGLAGCPPQSIQISVSENTPKSEQPGAYASARPYEGAHIVVYYDRISERRLRSLVPSLFAHVLVHEITHILEGLVRHSNSGVMKAHWDDDDFSQIARKGLKFAQADIDLIYAGLAARAARLPAP
jgi:hypothetical protein